jgi:hypothetical protein
MTAAMQVSVWNDPATGTSLASSPSRQCFSPAVRAPSSRPIWAPFSADGYDQVVIAGC